MPTGASLDAYGARAFTAPNPGYPGSPVAAYATPAGGFVVGNGAMQASTTSANWPGTGSPTAALIVVAAILVAIRFLAERGARVAP